MFNTFLVITDYRSQRNFAMLSLQFGLENGSSRLKMPLLRHSHHVFLINISKINGGGALWRRGDGLRWPIESVRACYTLRLVLHPITLKIHNLTRFLLFFFRFKNKNIVWGILNSIFPAEPSTVSLWIPMNNIFSFWFPTFLFLSIIYPVVRYNLKN